MRSPDASAMLYRDLQGDGKGLMLSQLRLSVAV